MGLMTRRLQQEQVLNNFDLQTAQQPQGPQDLFSKFLRGPIIPAATTGLGATIGGLGGLVTGPGALATAVGGGAVGGGAGELLRQRLAEFAGAEQLTPERGRKKLVEETVFGGLAPVGGAILG